MSAHSSSAPSARGAISASLPTTKANRANRTTARLVRFTPDELSDVTERSRECGRSLSQFIRDATLGAIPRARHRAEIDPILHQLARIARDLESLNRGFRGTPESNETVGRSHDTAALTARLSAALDAHTAAIRQVIAQSHGRRNRHESRDHVTPHVSSNHTEKSPAPTLRVDRKPTPGMTRKRRDSVAKDTTQGALW